MLAPRLHYLIPPLKPNITNWRPPFKDALEFLVDRLFYNQSHLHLRDNEEMGSFATNCTENNMLFEHDLITFYSYR